MNALLALTLSLTCSNTQPQPNVLFIAIDDLNDWVGCLGGHPQAHTPNIDRLARRGTLFTNAHCQAPICGPSRASMLSGRYPYTTGVYVQPKGPLDNDQKFFSGQMLPRYFARHGYLTMGVGKIHHGFTQTRSFEVNGPKGRSGPKPPNEFRFHYHLPDNPWSGTQTDWGAFPDVDSKMPDYETAGWAEEQLQKQHDRPFFLAVGFHRPHVPFYVPEKWFDRLPLNSVQLPPVRTDDLDDVPQIGRDLHAVPKYPGLSFLTENDNEQFKRCTQAYLACTTFVDHQVGRVLDALDASDYANNTIIVLVSDHGYHLGEKDRVSKHGLWEESTRVPLIISLPGGTTTRTSNKPVGLIDVYPTLLELAGLPAKAENAGRSLLPLLNKSDTSWRHSILTTYARGNHSLRSEDYRYIRYENGAEELYDHRSDPQEWKNIAANPAHANVLKKFRNELPQGDAPYHARQSPKPINAWFQKHLNRNGVR